MIEEIYTKSIRLISFSKWIFAGWPKNNDNKYHDFLLLLSQQFLILSRLGFFLFNIGYISVNNAKTAGILIEAKLSITRVKNCCR